VREQANRVLLEFVRVLKRKMAAQLSKMFGAWWVAMRDSCHDSAHVAKQAYEQAFPPLKRTEVS
jgi:hypothetical protein